MQAYECCAVDGPTLHVVCSPELDAVKFLHTSMQPEWNVGKAFTPDQDLCASFKKLTWIVTLVDLDKTPIKNMPQMYLICEICGHNCAIACPHVITEFERTLNALCIGEFAAGIMSIERGNMNPVRNGILITRPAIYTNNTVVSVCRTMERVLRCSLNVCYHSNGSATYVLLLNSSTQAAILHEKLWTLLARGANH
jgi:hypothetical protein